MTLLQISCALFFCSKSSVYACGWHIFYHSLWSTCLGRNEVFRSWKGRNQLILKRKREKEACFLYPDQSRNTWSGRFDAYCQQICAWKIRSLGYIYILFLLKQEWLPAFCIRRQSAFTLAPVALNSLTDHSPVCLCSILHEAQGVPLWLPPVALAFSRDSLFLLVVEGYVYNKTGLDYTPGICFPYSLKYPRKRNTSKYLKDERQILFYKLRSLVNNSPPAPPVNNSYDI